MTTQRPTRRGPLLPMCLVLALGAGPALGHDDQSATLGRLDAALARAPEDASLWHERSVLERRRGDFARAEADLARAAALGLEPALFERDLGLLRFEAGRFAEAEARLRAARALAPGDAPTLLAHARSLGALDRWREAAGAYDDLVALAPHSNPDVHLERIRAHAASDGEDALRDALDASEEALAALGPVPALEQEALALELRAGRTDAALARLGRILIRGPPQGELLLQRAELLERAGRRDAARAAYAEALAAHEARPASRRATPAGTALEARAREGLARLASGGAS